MSKIIATAVMRGTRDLVTRTEELLKKTIAERERIMYLSFLTLPSFSR